MRVPIYQLDAFTTRRFAGNPAAVIVLESFPESASMLAVAAENNLAETAFLVADGDDYRLRWFTPKVEVPLCGHATLASAAVVMERLQPGRTAVTFHSASGPLSVRRNGTGYCMDFPPRRAKAIIPSVRLAKILGAGVVETLDDTFNYIALLASAGHVREFVADLSEIAALDRGGLIVTAPGDAGYDIVSRYFAPAKGIDEDPVTGGAHCMLAPYWCARLGKAELRAFQASARGGEMSCRLVGERVELEGACIFYLEGEAEVPS